MKESEKEFSPLFGKATDIVSRITHGFRGEFGILFVVRDGAVAAMAAAIQDATAKDIRANMDLIAGKLKDMSEHVGKGINVETTGSCFVKNHETGEYEEKPYSGFEKPRNN